MSFSGDKKEFIQKSRTHVETVIDPKYWNTDNESSSKSSAIVSAESSSEGTLSERSKGIIVDNRTKESRTKPLILLRPDGKTGNTAAFLPTSSIHTNSCDQQNSSQSQTTRQPTEETDCTKTPVHHGKIDTWIFPLIQMGPLGITVDEEATSRVLTDLGTDMKCYLASGYFNLTRKYMDTVLRSKARFDVLMASPQVRGWGAEIWCGNRSATA